MRIVVFISLAMFLVGALCSCQQADPVAPVESTGAITFDSGFSPEIVARQAVDLAQWPKVDAESVELPLQEGPASVFGLQSEVLVDNIVHASFDVRVGDGPYDVIRLHRVYQEDARGRPLRTRDNVFLLHGDGVGFVKFLFGSATPVLPDDQSAAVFLAQNGIDVWGMDQNWAIVPPGLTDQSFSAEWGIQNQVNNLRAGIATARQVRLLTGGGPNKMNVLGYSSGGWTVYALANEETQRPPAFRQMAGMVIADAAFKVDPSRFETERVLNCETYAFYSEYLQDGNYDVGFGGFFQLMGYLADTDPDGDSPLAPGLTNLQFAIVAGSSPDPESGASPWYHFFAGVFVDDFPVDFSFTQVDAAVDFYQTASPFEALAFVVGYSEISCDESDVPFDDYLGDIQIPALYLGAAGGFGGSGLYSIGLLGSSDVSVEIVSQIPPEEVDFGHIDLWTADDAPELVWTPLLDWLQDHTPTAGGPVKWAPMTASY